MMKFIFYLSLIIGMHFNCYAMTINYHKTEKVIESLREKHKIPGVQVSIKNLKTNKTLDFSSGYANKDRFLPLQVNTLMQIGSTTKSFIASLTLLIESDSESGRLTKEFNINQTLGDWLPQYPAWNKVKIKQLLNMTSGIDNYVNEGLFKKIAKNPYHIWKDTELVNMVYMHKPKLIFSPGSKFDYSNTNYILVGMILEKVTGQSIEQLINNKILKKYPAYFKNTFYSPARLPNTQMMAHGLNMDKNEFTPFYKKDITNINLSWGAAAGALISNASDLSQWTGLLFSTSFLPTKQQNELQTLICAEPACKTGTLLPVNSKLSGYGLGIFRIHHPKYGSIWMHTGGTMGFHSLFMYLPKYELTLAVTINQNNPGKANQPDVMDIAEQVLDTIQF